MTHASYLLPTAFPCPGCPAGIARDCLAGGRPRQGFHAGRRHLADNLRQALTAAAVAELLELVLQLKLQRRESGGVETDTVTETRSKISDITRVVRVGAPA